MNSTDATLAMVDALASLNISYMLVGSNSSNYYGVPRSTKDADFVIQLDTHSVGEIAERLGPEFHFDPQMSFETVTGTLRHIVHVRELPFSIELFHLSDDAHDQERFRRRLAVEIQKRQIWLPTVEDVIITKLRWCSTIRRNKDWNDIRDVIAVQGDERIDWAYVHSWTTQHGTRGTLDEIRASIPPI